MTEKILITGAAGVIGRQFVPLLVQHNYDVIAIDKKAKPKEFQDGVHYLQRNINDLSAEELRLMKIDKVVHLAASFERTQETYEFYEQNFEDNVRASNNFLKACCALDTVKQIIFASSYLVYDQSTYLSVNHLNEPITLREDHTVMPRNLTGSAKLIHECEMDFMARFHPEKQFLTLRIYRGFGLGSRCIVSRWVRAALANEAINVFNDHGMFDYIYCKDTAKGLLLSVTENLSGVYNLGTGHSRRVGDIITHLKHRFPELEVIDGGHNGAVEFSQANIDKFKDACDYKADYSLEDAIDEIIDYEKNEVAQDEAHHHILVTSGGSKLPLLASASDWGKNNPHVQISFSELSDNSLAAYAGHHGILLQRTNDEHLPAIIETLQAEGVSHILPTRDGELPFWARHKEALATLGINVSISSPDTIATCQDKLAFYNFCDAHGFDAIQTVTHPLDAPCVVKPQTGSASEGLQFFETDAPAALESGYICQPMIEGEEYSFDGYSDSTGTLRLGQLRLREFVVQGESKVSTPAKNDDIYAACEQLLNKLKLIGPSVTQLFITADNQIKFIEVNPRVGGAYTTTIGAGLPFWHLLIDESTPVWDYIEPLPRRMVRVQTDIF